VDGILGQDKVLDINFAAGLPRVYLFPPRNDVVVAKKPVSAGHWTHLAVTRDAEGRWSIFQNGEHEATSAPTDLRVIEPSLGWTVPQGSLHGALAEYRIWSRALGATEIRARFDRAIDPKSRPADLIFQGSGREGWPKAAGIRVALRQDPPPILGQEEAVRLDAAFARWGKLIAEEGGDINQGKSLAALCRACHLIKGEGVAMGPDLSGVGSMGHDAILRNLLTPHAAYEPGYRIFRVTTKSGALQEGFLVSETPEAVLLRLVGGAEVRIERADIAETRWLNRSLMPAGLVENLPDAQARDLLAYLKSLR
jgi:putative heme-binding domain-containing protein